MPRRGTNLLALSRTGKKKEAMALFQSDFYPAFTKLRDATIAINANAKDSAKTAGTQIMGIVATGKNGSLIGIGAALVAGVALALLITTFHQQGPDPDFRYPRLRLAADQFRGRTSLVLQQSLAQGASEQAAALEETTSALEEMSSMTKKNAETAQQAAGLSSEAQKSAAKGNDAMGKMSTAINDIQKSATETAKIIKVIDEIAFQTNLLALNAAVEAARAR